MRFSSSIKSLGWCLVLTCAAHAQAGWTTRESHTESSTVPGVVLEHLVDGNSATDAEATLDLMRFASKPCRLRLVDNPTGDNLATAMGHGNFVAGVNGGYFDENFKPLGLRVSEGKSLAPLIRARLMTGLIVCSESGTRILRVSEFAKNSHPSTALQCGPLLVDRGHAVAGLDSTRSARRTFAATTSNQVLLGFSSAVSLAELSEILAGGMGDAKTQRALNLDGGSSSAFWFKRKDGTIISKSESKSVRDFLAVEPK